MSHLFAPPAATVYIDPLMTCLMSKAWRWPKSCHMFVGVGTDLEVLHAFAESIGLRRAWFQSKPGGLPHYDLHEARRRAAVRLGAVELDRRAAVTIFRQWKGGVAPAPTPAPTPRPPLPATGGAAC